MAPRWWTIDEVLELVRGATVAARDLQARSVPLPEVLAAACRPDDRSWDVQLGQDHPKDFGTVVDTWWRAVADAGVLHTSHVRRQTVDGWFEHEISVLNLSAHPDVGAVLTISRPLRPVEEPDDVGTGDGASFEAPHSVVQHLDELGAIVRTEGDVEQVFGTTAEELKGHAILDHLHPDDRDAAVAMWLEILAAPENSRTIQQRVVRPDGSVMWIQSTVMNQLPTDGTVLAMSHDISAVRDQQAALAASEAQLRFLTEAVPVGVFRASAGGDLTYVNARWTSLLGSARTVEEVLQLIAHEDRGQLVRAAESSRDDVSDGVIRVRTLDDRHLEIRLHGVIGPAGDVEVIGTVDDVTSTVIRTFELQARAERDPLTNLANRRGLSRTLDAAVVGNRSALVVFGDLDDFKAVNDEWGHDAGDHVLTAIGRRLAGAVRPGDVVGRWGGDEFLVICLDVPEGHEHHVVERLHRALAEPILVGDRRYDRRYDARVSLGVVRPRAGETAEDVLRRADTAMYDAKRARHSV